MGVGHGRVHVVGVASVFGRGGGGGLFPLLPCVRVYQRGGGHAHVYVAGVTRML